MINQYKVQRHIFLVYLYIKSIYTQVNILKSSIFLSAKSKSEFFVLEEDGSFDEAIDKCKEIDSFVARIVTIEEYNVVSELLSSFNDTEKFHIGLRREGITVAFKHINGPNDNNTFFSIPFELPWNNNEPNNSPEASFCVVTSVGDTSTRWFDEVCTFTSPVAVFSRSCGSGGGNGVVSDCFNDDFEIFVIDGEFTFNDANRTCVENEGSLLSIQNRNEFDLIETFLTQTELFNETFAYIDLRRGSFTDPLQFNYVDGSLENKSFFEFRRTFPWADDQPNNVGGNQECVDWSILFQSERNVWGDRNCADVRNIICRKDTKLDNLEDSMKFNTTIIGGMLIILLLLCFEICLLRKLKQKVKLVSIRIEEYFYLEVE